MEIPEIVSALAVIVMDLLADVTGSYEASPALVALTTHVPAPVGVKVEAVTVQGPETFAKVTLPVPDPPEVVSDKSFLYATVVWLTVKVAWESFGSAGTSELLATPEVPLFVKVMAVPVLPESESGALVSVSSMKIVFVTRP